MSFGLGPKLRLTNPFQSPEKSLALSKSKDFFIRHVLFFLAILITVTGCQLTPQKTDPIAVLETIKGPHIIIAETSAVLSQFASMDVFLNGEYVGTSNVPIIMVPVIQTNNHLVTQGLFATSYADFGELKFKSADQNHHYIMIDAS